MKVKVSKSMNEKAADIDGVIFILNEAKKRVPRFTEPSIYIRNDRHDHRSTGYDVTIDWEESE